MKHVTLLEDVPSILDLRITQNFQFFLISVLVTMFRAIKTFVTMTKKEKKPKKGSNQSTVSTERCGFRLTLMHCLNTAIEVLAIEY